MREAKVAAAEAVEAEAVEEAVVVASSRGQHLSKLLMARVKPQHLASALTRQRKSKSLSRNLSGKFSWK